MNITELTGGTALAVASQATASVTPTANRPLFVVVSSDLGGGSAPVIPTLSGAGLTWAQVPGASGTYTDSATGTGRTTVFRGISASPTPGAITIDFGAESQQYLAWTVLDVEDGDDVEQTVTANGTGTAAGATLASFAGGSNGTLLVVGAYTTAAVTFTPDGLLSGFTERGIGSCEHRVAWLNGADLTPSMTLSVATAHVAIAMEITAAGGGGADPLGDDYQLWLPAPRRRRF